jgi:sodium transport system ATP-binding protein
MIQTHALSKVFPDAKKGPVTAVDGVSIECRPGEIFGLLGPNGAGKTTLLRMLATILQPTGGEATVAGFDVARQGQDVRRSIGYVSTATALYERLSPREMVTYFGALYSLPLDEVKRRMERLFDELDINEFADRRCDKLSTGQKQRVSIARTILHEPPVLFFDEPTNGLDVLASRAIVRFIRRCRDEGRTVVFSTHIMSEVEALCDRIAVIYQGRVAAVGTLDELRAQTGEQLFERVFLRVIGEDPDA